MPAERVRSNKMRTILSRAYPISGKIERDSHEQTKTIRSLTKSDTSMTISTQVQTSTSAWL